MKRTPKTPSVEIAEWRGKFIMATEAAYLPLRDRRARDALMVAGALVALASNAKDTYWALCALLIGPGRPKQWTDALSKVPATQAAVDALTAVVRTYERQAQHGFFQTLTGTRIAQLPAVVEGMVAVSGAPGAYLDACADMWFDHPTKVFSLEIRNKIAPKLRGLLGDQGKTGHRAGRARRVG